MNVQFAFICKYQHSTTVVKSLNILPGHRSWKCCRCFLILIEGAVKITNGGRWLKFHTHPSTSLQPALWAAARHSNGSPSLHCQEGSRITGTGSISSALLCAHPLSSPISHLSPIFHPAQFLSDISHCHSHFLSPHTGALISITLSLSPASHYKAAPLSPPPGLSTAPSHSLTISSVSERRETGGDS